jgi:hypothetical protein
MDSEDRGVPLSPPSPAASSPPWSRGDDNFRCNNVDEEDEEEDEEDEEEEEEEEEEEDTDATPAVPAADDVTDEEPAAPSAPHRTTSPIALHLSCTGNALH